MFKRHLTGHVAVKNDRYYAVINYKEGGAYKQKWVALGLPVKNNKRKAEALLQDIKQEFEERLFMCSADMHFVDFLEKWLEEKKPYVQQSTWEGYATYVHRHIVPYFKPLNLMLSEIKRKHISDYYKFKYIKGRLDGKQGGLSIASIKKHAIVIKEALDDAVLSDFISVNPATGIRMPGKNLPTREKVFLNAEEANDLIKIFEGHPLQSLIYVTLYYGLRRSEALGLRWSAIDFDKNTITINHSVVKGNQGSVIYKDQLKTESSYHTYELIEDVKKVLLKHKERQEANKVLFKEIYQESDYVFTWDDGSLFRPDYITRAMKNQLKKYNFKPITFHALRHSAASILHDKGWDLVDAKDWLRHSSVDVTADVYTHIAQDRKSKMAHSLNNTLVI